MKHILIISCLIFLGAAGFSQDNSSAAKSTYTVEKEEAVKNFLPGAGILKGTIHILNKKTVIPLAFIDVEKGKQLQADKKGYFELEMDTGTYNITISSVGYKDLLIKDFTIKWGKEHTIKVSLAGTSGFHKN